MKTKLLILVFNHHKIKGDAGGIEEFPLHSFSVHQYMA